MGITAYVLFFLAGLGFGYAAPPKWRWIPFLFPLLLGLAAILQDGLDASILLRLLVALIVTALGVLVGTMIDARSSEQGDHPRYA
ncbi:MAG: hypothetical protein QOE69_2666 [Thermoleophilaceae bacterium]|nr:hypothetical protein [Thermoleophilaceae bacterium]MEA2408547.1 hypothetical protein [Thermoleophilaceae bacterium]